MSDTPDPVLEAIDAELDRLTEQRARLESELEQVAARVDQVASARSILAGEDPPPPAEAPDDAAPPAKATPDPRSKPAPEGERVFRCDLCGRECASGTGLAAHRRWCDPSKPAKPTAAAQTTKRERSTPKPRHSCPGCGQTFMTGGSLSAHRHRDDCYTDEERAADAALDEAEAALEMAGADA
ncbi:MAG: hypothetical protein R2695_03985 [Acidimicrobiales bacterium]